MSCLYIDADNVSYKILNKLEKDIDMTDLMIKKIYGDWSKTELKNWIKKIIKYGMEPIQCFHISKKQTTDIRLITDLLNDIYTNDNIKHIYLCTSDVDYSYVCQLIKKKSIYLTVISTQSSVLKNYANDYIDTSIQEIEYVKNELDYFIQAISGNYILLISTFKKELKKIIPDEFNIKWKSLESLLNEYNDYFMIIKKKNRVYIIFINNFLVYDKNNIYKYRTKIENNYKNIFLIIDFESFVNQLF